MLKTVQNILIHVTYTHQTNIPRVKQCVGNDINNGIKSR